MSEALRTSSVEVLYQLPVAAGRAALHEVVQEAPPTSGAQYLLGKVVGEPRLDMRDLSQAEVEHFFEATVFPALTEARHWHNAQNQRKVSAGDIAQALADRFHEMRLRLRGYTPEEIAAQTGIEVLSVKSNINRTLRMLRYPDSPYGPGYFQAKLTEQKPGFVVAPIAPPPPPPKPVRQAKPRSLRTAGRPSTPASATTAASRPARTAPSKPTRKAPLDPFKKARTQGYVENPNDQLFDDPEHDAELHEARRAAYETTTTDSVRMYLNEIGKVALLNAEQEVELAKRIEAGLYAEAVLEERTKRLTGDQEPGMLNRYFYEQTRVETVQRAEAQRRQHRAEQGGRAPGLVLKAVNIDEAEVAIGAAHRLEAALARFPQAEVSDRDLRSLIEDGEKAKDHLVRANLRLVVSIAKRHAPSLKHMAFLDLISEGNFGLIRAVEKFDYTKGNKFSTYATGWIRQALGRAKASQDSLIRKPIPVVDEINKVIRTKKELEQDMGREATLEELGAEIGMAPERVEELMSFGDEPTSLDKEIGAGPAPGERESYLVDMLTDETEPEVFDVVAQQARSEAVMSMLRTLTESERSVVMHQYGMVDGQPRTPDQIGQLLGLTREGVRQTERAVMAKLRHPSRAQLVRDYLD